MRRTWVKCICAVLCVLTLTVGVVGGTFAPYYYIERPQDGGFYNSADCYRVTREYRDRYWNLIDLRQMGEGDAPPYYVRQSMEEIIRDLAAENTNFRYRCLDEAGEILDTNVPEGQTLEEVVHSVSGDSWETDAYTLYGQQHYTVYILEYGVLEPLAAEDGYSAALEHYQQTTAALEAIFPALAWVCGGCLVAGLILLAILICAAGRRPGRTEVVLNLQDRVPYDIYLALVVCGVASAAVLGDSCAYYYNVYGDTGELIAFALAALAIAVLLLAAVLSTATRIKARTIFRNTLIWRICTAVRRAFRTLPMVWRAVVLFLLYLLGTALTTLTVLLIPVYQGLVLWLLCRWVLQWRQIRQATEAIVAGHTDVRIDHRKFYPDLYRHAAQLNDLGSSIDHAVEERMKSERFRTELITNVSHDLKTPLTSIINYVDLLKKEQLQNPKAQEYLKVLDRKSQRLKKLTEDLVEASKASTGALTVNRERLDLAQLAEQAAGEYREKLSAAGLTLVVDLPETGVPVLADGRHVWRVLDNLLGNCVKYALEGTRVYLDVAAWDGQALLSVKNISRQPLNIPAEQLMERFVRGDESRTTEGSGLGLSIARSLTELQGGIFSLAIDGDLFKASVRFPLAEKPAPLQAAAPPPAAQGPEV